MIVQAQPENNARERKVTVEELLDRAAKEIDRSFTGGPLHEAAIRQAIGRSYLRLGQFSKAEPHLRRNLEIRRKELGPEDPATLHALQNIALLLGYQGKYAESEQLVRRVLEARRRVLGPEHPDTLLQINNLATVLLKAGEAG